MLTLTHSHRTRSVSRANAPESRGKRLVRALGLTFVYNLYYKIKHKGQPIGELRKIAIRKDFLAATLAGLIHFLPVGAAFVLVIINWRGYYIGGELAGAVGEDDAKFIGIQFAAKIHELFISASLTAVIFSYIRHEIVNKNGLPFGAVSAGFQFKDISYLGSMEFRGALRANWGGRRDKTALILLIMTCAGLALSAGPSSATLMKPRQDWWPAGGTDFWVGLSPEELYSTNASASQVPASCMSDTGDLSCPSGGWRTLADDFLSFFQSIRRAGYMPDIVQVSGPKAVRALRVIHRIPFFQFSGDWTQATVGSSSIADGLVETGRLWAYAVFWWRRGINERFWSRLDATYTVQAHQPLVHVRCTGFNNLDFITSNGINTSASTITVYDLSDQDHYYAQGDFGNMTYNYADNAQVNSVITNVLNSTVPQIAWTVVPQSNDSTLGAFLSLPIGGDNASMLFQCTIAARMAPGKLSSTRDSPLIVTGADHANIYDNKNTFPRISIDPAWAAFLNPTMSPDNTTVYDYMMTAAGILDNGLSINAGIIVYVMETLLSLSVVNGLGRRDFGTGFSGTLKGNDDGLDLVSDHDLEGELDSGWGCEGWCRHLLPSVGYGMGYGGNAFNISDSEKAASTKFTMEATAMGWALNAKGSAAKFAIFALLLYSTIALCHWIYTGWDRETSHSWGSISELVAIAMRSDHSEIFVNTGAGIDSSAIFKQPTQIIDKDGRLQLAVGNDVGHFRLVRPNEYYA